MRLLHTGPDHERNWPDRGRPGRRRPGAGARRHERKPLPMRGLCGDHRSGVGRPARSCRGKREALGMKSFDYVRPATVSEAVAAAAAPGAAYLAAGTNLLDLMKGGITQPNRLVDITHLAGLDRVDDLPDGGVPIGALVRHADPARGRNFPPRF